MKDIKEVLKKMTFSPNSSKINAISKKKKSYMELDMNDSKIHKE